MHRKSMHAFVLPKCSLIVAIRSLGFESEYGFQAVSKAIPNALMPNGILVAHFFGILKIEGTEVRVGQKPDSSWFCYNLAAEFACMLGEVRLVI